MNTETPIAHPIENSTCRVGCRDEGETRRPARTHVRPDSAVSIMTGLAGLLALAFGLWVSLGWGLSVQESVPLCLVLPVASMLIWEVVVEKVHRKPESGLDFSNPWPLKLTLGRSLTKLFGIWTTWSGIAAVYAFLPYYQEERFQPLFRLLLEAAPLLVIASIPYVFFVDLYSKDPYDENWNFGCLVRGTNEPLDLAACKNHALNYTIKGFFLPFMFSAFIGSYEYLASFNFREITSSRIMLYSATIEMMYYIDIVFATVGYALTLRLFGAHIRSPNRILLGWMAALACYEPFAVMARESMFNYRTGDYWQTFVSSESTLGALLVIAILSLTFAYSWATVAFGIRFSNLTHRGIITNGPYSLTKHPAYIAKNLSWWLIYLPFVPVVGVRQAIGGCLALLVVNGIYYVRAKTEEAHLMEDPTYAAYASYIAENGLFARIVRFGRSQNSTAHRSGTQ